MRFLRTNTAVIVTVGPFYDKTDGVTIETALTITNERITLTADTDAGSAPTNILDNITGATSATANDLNYITGNDAGMMQLELAAADVNRLGRMFLSITDAANHVPVFHEFMVMPALVYDTFFASSGGATFPAATLASTTNITAGTVTTATNVTTVNGLAANVITAAATAADFSVEVAAGVWQTAVAGNFTVASSIGKALFTGNIVPGAAGGLFIAGTNAATTITTGLTTTFTGNLTGSVASVTGAVGSVTGAVGSVTGAVGSVTAGVTLAADAITAAATAADFTTEIQAGLATAANLATVAGYLDTEIAAILADTNELQTDWVNGGRLDLILDARASQTSVDTVDTVVDAILVDTAEIGAAGAGLTALATQASVNTIDDLLDTEVAAIKTVVDSILVDTAEIGAAGAGLTALATQASVDIIDNFLDTEVAAIKTVTDAIGATGTGLSSIPWNAAWDAEVQSEAADAITAAGLATAAALDAVDDFVDTEVAAIKAVTDKLDTALELDGAVYRYTVNALELAPTGGSAPTVGQIADEVQTRTIAAVTVVNGLAANVITAAATAADFTTEVTAGLSTAASIAALNNLSAAQVNAEVDTAIADAALATAAEIADAVLDEAVDGAITLRQSVRLQNSAMGGKASGLNTTTAVYRDLADTIDRITATVDADGNRSAVTRDLT